MTTHKISNELYEHAYALIAIHCSMEDYRMAYTLNLRLGTKFKRLPDMDFQDKSRSFTLYEWEDLAKDTLWHLISNTSGDTADETKNNTLFDNENMVKINYLIPERKQTDYFLKIDGELMQEHTTSIQHTIHRIPQVIATYTIDPNQLKSKYNLIT